MDGEDGFGGQQPRTDAGESSGHAKRDRRQLEGVEIPKREYPTRIDAMQENGGRDSST